MKISYNWLKDFINTDLPTDKVSEILTDIGLEVEGTEVVGVQEEDLKNFVVGEVISCEKHPNADKLKVTKVDLGNGNVEQIVCGAPNVALGQKVPVATSGAIIKDGKGGEFEIKKMKLRGESSNGMICSKKELRLSEDHGGIWEMDSDLVPGTPLADIIDTTSDTVFEIGLTPNRADAMSHFGVARDLYAALKNRKLSAEKINKNFKKVPTSKVANPISVEILDMKNCPRYAGISMKNVKVAESPKWLQDRLKVIGLSPLNNVVDVTNYVLHSLGQPMHAFDADKIKGNKINVQSGVYKDAQFTTLDKVDRKLAGTELLICDTENPIAIGGVMGGLDSSVTAKTTNIFLESAYFDPVSVRKTSKAHHINSDSSFRFERGIDPNITIKALEMAVELISELANAEVVGEVIDHYPTPIKNHKAILNYRKIDSLIGERLHRETIKEILNSLEIEILTETNDILELEIPAYRVDVQREADLIEEIMRIYGFNKIGNPEKLSVAIVPGNGFPEDTIENTMANMLVDQGFYEAMNLSMHKDDYNKWLDLEDEKSVDIINSLSADLTVMRRSLLPGLLENVDYNIKRKKDQIKLFELGKSYQKIDGEFHETKTLGIVIAGNWNKESWTTKREKVSFLQLSGLINQILRRLKVTGVQLEAAQTSYEENGIDYLVNGQKIAHLSKISKKVLKKFDIDQEVLYAEIYVKDVIKLVQQQAKLKYHAISKFPMVRRDLALLLDKEVTYQEIENLVKKTDDNLIKNVNLFDVYEGDRLPAGKKSYAISINLQDENKTMNDKQIDKLMKKVVNSLKQELKAELRT